MAKGKYKHKKEHGQQQGEQGTPSAVVLEKKEITENETNRSPQTARKTSNDKDPSRWRRFKEWAKNSSSLTDWCIAFFTFVLGAAAIYQFIIMDRQLDVMRKDQRAWIAVNVQGDPRFVIDAAPSAPLTITDTGKTPATQIVGDFYVELIPEGQNPHFEAQIPHFKMFSGIAIPNAPQSVVVSRQKLRPGGNPAESEGDPLTEDEKTALDSGRLWRAVHGTVWYDDVFGTRHWIRFCFWTGLIVGKSYSSGGCVAYNATDNN
jgi:hypothetical protein